MGKCSQNAFAVTIENSKFKLLKILIVDDNLAIGQVLCEFIKDYGNEILIARSGEEAIELFEKNLDIDLILMDAYMPRMSGAETTNMIRQFHTNVVIIIATAFPLSEITEEFAGVAMDDYLPKPFSKFNINQLIIKHFKSKYQLI
jgi:CheY-like chemotaxis protein